MFEKIRNIFKKIKLGCDIQDATFIEVTNVADQGDVRVMRVKKIPAAYILATESDRNIVAHSETGHHHMVRNEDVHIYSNPKNPRKKYAVLRGTSAQVIHLRDYMPHKTLLLKGEPGDVFKFVRSVDFWDEQSRLRSD